MSWLKAYAKHSRRHSVLLVKVVPVLLELEAIPSMPESWVVSEPTFDTSGVAPDLERVEVP